MPSLVARRPTDLAAVVRGAREEAGISQAELADHLAFSRDYMVELESGRSNIYARRLFRVLHELGVTMTLEYGDGDGGA